MSDETATTPKIAFVGLGIMGEPMAGHLIQAGNRVFLHSRTRAKAARLESLGGIWCDTPAAAAREADVFMTNVTDAPDVEMVLFGPRGEPERKECAAATLRRGAIVVDFSTISPAASRDIAGRLASREIAFLDAPVTGGQVGAQNGTLTIMVGGIRTAFERVEPLLRNVGKRILHVGASGAGQMLKACNQVLCAVNMIGVCEAIMLARQAGLNLGTMIETLSTGAGGSWALQVLGAKIAAGDLNPAFMIRLMQKDLRIVQETAEDLGLGLPGTTLAQQLFDHVAEMPGGTELGTQAMIKAFES